MKCYIPKGSTIFVDVDFLISLPVVHSILSKLRWKTLFVYWTAGLISIALFWRIRWWKIYVMLKGNLYNSEQSRLTKTSTSGSASRFSILTTLVPPGCCSLVPDFIFYYDFYLCDGTILVTIMSSLINSPKQMEKREIWRSTFWVLLPQYCLL